MIFVIIRNGHLRYLKKSQKMNKFNFTNKKVKIQKSLLDLTSYVSYAKSIF